MTGRYSLEESRGCGAGCLSLLANKKILLGLLVTAETSALVGLHLIAPDYLTPQELGMLQLGGIGIGVPVAAFLYIVRNGLRNNRIMEALQLASQKRASDLEYRLKEAQKANTGMSEVYTRAMQTAQDAYREAMSQYVGNAARTQGNTADALLSTGNAYGSAKRAAENIGGSEREVSEVLANATNQVRRISQPALQPVKQIQEPQKPANNTRFLAKIRRKS